MAVGRLMRSNQPLVHYRTPHGSLLSPILPVPAAATLACSIKTLCALLALSLSGCAAQYYSCKLPNPDSWQELSASPPDIEYVLRNSDRHVERNIATADVVRWFERADGSFLACLPARIEGTCGRDELFRENACGQATYEFAKSGDEWAEAEWSYEFCTCDPRPSR